MMFKIAKGKCKICGEKCNITSKICKRCFEDIGWKHYEPVLNSEDKNDSRKTKRKTKI